VVAFLPKLVAVKVLLVIVAVTSLGLILRQVISNESKPATLGEQAAPSVYTQTDIEEGIKVVATYLPAESGLKELVFNIELSSVGPDLSKYDVQGHIVLANGDITPVATKSTSYNARTKDKVAVRMIFERTPDTHYHLLVQDLAGVGERVLHFYL
jgi:hypothetical protein